MTLECLPRTVRDAVESVIKGELFATDAKFTAGEISSNSIATTYRAEVKDKDRVISLYIKYLKKDDERFVSEGALYFNNEIIFYGEIVQAFLQLDERRKCDISIPFSVVPKCIFVGHGEEPFIILENLTNRGYVPLDIKHPLTIECAQLVLKQLGQLHAYSFAMKNQHHQEFTKATEKLKEPIFRIETKTTFGNLFIRAIHDSFKLAKQALPKGSVCIEKLALFTLNILDTMMLLAEGDEDDEQYKVVTHGDLWTNNILCRFSEENKNFPENTVFTDFQGCRYSSPVHDLMFVILVGVNKDTRENYRDDLIRCYHIALCEKLQELGSDPLLLFPYSALHNQLAKHTKFVLAMALAGLPLYLTDEAINIPQENAQDFVDNNKTKINTLEEYVLRVNSRKSLKCKNKMLEILMDVVNEGYL